MPPNTEAPDRGAFVEAGVVATAGRDLNPPSSPPEATGRLAALLAGRDQLAQELLDAGVDVVADAAHHLDRLAGRVLELPVLIALARIDRTGISTTHGDHHIGGPDEVIGQGLGQLPGEVDAPLLHGRDHGRVELVPGG
jgi:hypothetical protein